MEHRETIYDLTDLKPNQLRLRMYFQVSLLSDSTAVRSTNQTKHIFVYRTKLIQNLRSDILMGTYPCFAISVISAIHFLMGFEVLIL